MRLIVAQPVLEPYGPLKMCQAFQSIALSVGQFTQYDLLGNRLERLFVAQRDAIVKDQNLDYPLTDSNLIKQIWKGK